MPIPAASLSPLFMNSPYYTLNIKLNKTNIKLFMQLHIAIVNTLYLPHTYSVLKKQLPNVLLSQCFNDDELPFSKEVRRTEIGHLFEHVLLEYLCLEKISRGSKRATFSGNTNWNWREETRGSFHIKISAGLKDTHILAAALEKTVILVNTIVQFAPQSVPSSVTPQPGISQIPSLSVVPLQT